MAWSFIPAWTQALGWLTLRLSPLPGSAKSSPSCYWKGFQELEARFTQRVHPGSGGGGRPGVVQGHTPRQQAPTGEGGREGASELRTPELAVYSAHQGACGPKACALCRASYLDLGPHSFVPQPFPFLLVTPRVTLATP